jgi:hypothetical protein
MILINASTWSVIDLDSMPPAITPDDLPRGIFCTVDAILEKRLIPWVDPQACRNFMRNLVDDNQVAHFIRSYVLLDEGDEAYNLRPIAAAFKPGDSVKPLLPLVSSCKNAVRGLVSILAMDARSSLPYSAPPVLYAMARGMYNFLLASILEVPERGGEILPAILPLVLEELHFSTSPLFEPLIHFGSLLDTHAVIQAMAEVVPDASSGLLSIYHSQDSEENKLAGVRDVLSSIGSGNDLDKRMMSAMLVILAAIPDCPEYMLLAIAQSKFKKAKAIAELRSTRTPAKRIAAYTDLEKYPVFGKSMYNEYHLAAALLHPNLPDDVRFSILAQVSKYAHEVPHLVAVLSRINP